MRGAAFAALLLYCASASAGARQALLVGSREGAQDQIPLRFTSEDVSRLAAVLTDLGGVAPKDIGLLKDTNAAEVLARLDALANPTGEEPELFVFYYSGHADGAGLQLAGTTLPLQLLLAKISAVPAKLRLVILDACQSGAAMRSKGVSIGAPFEVQVDTSASSGDVIISSSAATEQSYESDAARAAVFSLHFTSALRGAADSDGDGVVTLSEAYRYAYAQTLRSTLLTRGGPQRPTFRWDLEGHREPVLTRLNASARLTLQSAEEGELILFDEEEQRVLAEVHVEKNGQARLGLAPGTYVVKKRGTRDLRSARIKLGPEDDRILDDTQMPAIALIRLARKGGLGNLFLSASAGQLWSAFGERGQLWMALGPEWERGRWLLGAQLLLSGGPQEHAGLVTHEQSAGLLASALTGTRIGNMMLRAGPALGAQLVGQQPAGRDARVGLAWRAGPRLRLDVDLTANLALFANLDAQLFAAPAEGTYSAFSVRAGRWGLFGWIGYAVGISSAW